MPFIMLVTFLIAFASFNLYNGKFGFTQGRGCMIKCNITHLILSHTFIIPWLYTSIKTTENNFIEIYSTKQKFTHHKYA